MAFSLDFIRIFFYGLSLIAPVVLFLAVLIVLLGQLVGRLESWDRFNAFYWSLVTAMTVGYGDITPKRKASKLLSLVIAFIGLILAGITVAIALEAAKQSFEKNSSIGKDASLSTNMPVLSENIMPQHKTEALLIPALHVAKFSV